MAKLTFKTVSQVVLFRHELCGQISDGHWENLGRRDHWQAWCDCEVAVGSPVGRDFFARYDGYNFTSAELLSVVEKRMLGQVRVALAYGEENVEVLEHLFDCDGWTGIPTYEDHASSNFWAERRAAIAATLTRLGVTLEQVKAVVESDAVYNRKALLADLREMKKTIKICL